MIKLTSIQSGYFKLDGGAMFGVVPKNLWNRLNKADENNLCTWSMRCLLIETGERKILVDTGLGDKQSEKFFSFYEPHGPYSLLSSLANAGCKAEDITDVFLTHHHFDHDGGAVKRAEDGELVPVFPNAVYWSNRKHFDWAYEANPREKASFLKENFVPLRDHGVMKFVPEEEGIQWLPGIQVRFCYGHTEAMMLLDIDLGERHLIYCADLIPASYHVRMPYIMAYDLRPLNTLAEKKRVLERAVDRNDILFFEHDPSIECASLTRDKRGRIGIDKTFTVSEIHQL